jgi:cytochrome oxidase Cu insertion factor (SCO1/SenC/PrrC family)
MGARGLFTWLRAAVLAGALLLGIGVGVGFAFLQKSGPAARGLMPATRPAATWAAGVKRAPEFRLRDQNGRPVSLRALRGRPVLLTFIDPVCRNLCPLEAKVLVKAAEQVGSSSRLAIVAVSVNPWGQTPHILRRDVEGWRLGRRWSWAVGPYRTLSSIWRRYAIGVRVTRTRFRGVPVRTIVHTEASYLIDAHGYQRALFVYPFVAGDVARTIAGLE